MGNIFPLKNFPLPIQLGEIPAESEAQAHRIFPSKQQVDRRKYAWSIKVCYEYVDQCTFPFFPWDGLQVWEGGRLVHLPKWSVCERWPEPCPSPYLPSLHLYYFKLDFWNITHFRLLIKERNSHNISPALPPFSFSHFWTGCFLLSQHSQEKYIYIYVSEWDAEWSRVYLNLCTHSLLIWCNGGGCLPFPPTAANNRKGETKICFAHSSKRLDGLDSDTNIPPSPTTQSLHLFPLNGLGG